MYTDTAPRCGKLSQKLPLTIPQQLSLNISLSIPQNRSQNISQKRSRQLSQNVSQVISGAGSFHSLMIMADKTVMSFGWNQFGQLGLGTNGSPDITSPQAITGLSNVKQAAASYMHTLLLFEDGTVKSFGYGSYGQLGHNDNTMHNSPKGLINFANVQVVAVGAYHSIILSY